MPVTPDPVAAVTVADPSRIYAAYAATGTLIRDATHRMWIAGNPAVAREVLAHPDCRVRPPGAPVPPALAGTFAGRIFASLVRMTDSAPHERLKRTVNSSLEALGPAGVHRAATEAARLVLDTHDHARFGSDVPTVTMGMLLGVPRERLADLSSWTSAFARALSPIASASDLSDGSDASACLSELMAGILAAPGRTRLTSTLSRTFALHGVDGEVPVIANMIGFLFQAHDATAGLIGNTLVHLSRYPEALQQPVSEVVAEVARRDPSIQNTRRFVARDTIVAGTSVEAGDAILVVLAGDGSCPFGHGRHACPGRELALAIATAAVERIANAGALPLSLASDVTYRPSANARIPDIGQQLHEAMKGATR